MHVTAHLDVDLIALESEDSVTCLLQLQAPVLPADQARPGQTLVVVLDRSGSMSGTPLDTAKDALRQLTRRLAPQDRFGLVVFDDSAQLVVPVRTMLDHDPVIIDSLIAAIDPGGSTDLWAGYDLALREVTRSLRATSADPTVVDAATVVIVSDGHANSGITDPDQLRGRALVEYKNDAITSLTIGLGLGYDEVLLAAIADGGSGAHRFAASADELPAVLADEVTGLLDKSVLAASLRITGRDDHLTGTATLQGLPTWVEGDTTVVALGDLYAGEERRTLIRLDVASIPALGLATIADIVLEYTALPDQLVHTVNLPITVNVVPGDVAAQRVPMPEVVVEQLLIEAATAKGHAAESLRAGDTASAQAALDAVTVNLGSLSRALEVLRRHGHIDPARNTALQATIALETAEFATMRDQADVLPGEHSSKLMMMAESGGRRGRARPAKGIVDACPVCGSPIAPGSSGDATALWCERCGAVGSP